MTIIYTPRTPPYAHQRAALNKGWRRPGFAYLMDMGCVDADTEYLSPQGWVKISEYPGGPVAQFHLDGTATFVEPDAYVVKSCNKFYHYKTARGVDQMLSEDHRILFCGAPTVREKSHKGGKGEQVGLVPDGFRTAGTHWTSAWRVVTPRTLTGSVHIPTCFNLITDTSLDLTDEQIRVQVAFHADGSFGQKDFSARRPGARGAIRIKRERKKVRLRGLLAEAAIPYVEKDVGGGFSTFLFIPPRQTKTYGTEWWQASHSQRVAICDECCHWDGTHKKNESAGRQFVGTIRGDIEFIQWCYSSTGHRAYAAYGPEENSCHSVNIVGSGRTNNLAMLYRPTVVDTPGANMYCFSVPSSYLVFRRNGRVFCSGNTGKTKTLIDNFCMLHQQPGQAGAVDGLLLVAPKGVYHNWTRESDENPGELQKWLWEDILPTTYVYTWVSGKSKREKNQHAALLDTTRPGVRVLAVNAEALSTTAEAYDLCERFLKAHKCMIAVDESTLMQDPKSSRSMALLRLRKLAPYRRILTGSPTKGLPTDLYTQFDFLGSGLLGHTSWFTFRAAYCTLQDMVVNGRTIKKITGARNVAMLAKAVEEHSYRCRKSECLDLPPKVFERRDVELTPEQKRMYTELRKTAMAELSGEILTTQLVVTQIMRMHQIVCGHAKLDDDTVVRLPNNRVAALDEIIAGTDEQMIIWCMYQEDIAIVVEHLHKEHGKESVAEWHGKTPNSEREAGELDFQAGRRRFMVASKAGARGRTWTAATLVVYYANDYDLEVREQSEDRAHRIGQTKTVTYIDLVSPGTVEEKIITALRNKKDVVRGILRDGPADWI